MPTPLPTPPAALGYRMPPEWAPHQGTWLSWPHNRDTWPGNFAPVEPVMVQAVRALATSETVHINVLDDDHAAHVAALLDGIEGDLRLHRFPTNDAWCRDHGATFVIRQSPGAPSVAAVDWQYNAWGGKYPPFDLDNAIPRQMAEVLGVPRFEGGMVLEGGSIEVNGDGLLLTTRRCLLNPNRNPGLTQREIEARLQAMLGIEKVLWVDGDLAGDDTDAHIDNLARFVSRDTILAIEEDDPADANYAPLQAMLAELRTLADQHGQPLRIETLPMPGPVYYEGHRLPASYANFYIANTVVLVPIYRCPQDAVAMATLQRHFPTRRIVGIEANELVWGLGAFHCLTQQVPASLA